MSTTELHPSARYADAEPPRLMYVGGQWIESESGARAGSIDPGNGAVWSDFPEGTQSDVDHAVRAAQAAMDGEWGQTPGSRRARLLYRLAELVERDGDALAQVESTDNGKLIRETRAVMSQVPVWLRFYAGAADKLTGHTHPVDDPGMLVYTLREPVGVVAAIVAWNNPIMMAVMKAAPALAAGCAVIVKPADQAPASTLALAALFDEAGFPPGAFNVLTGNGAVVGNALASHPGVHRISFTGSTTTGTSVMQAAATHVAPVSLELGGKSPNIVFEDADLDAAVNGVMAGIFASSGQMCIAGSRLVVQRRIQDELVERIRARAEKIRIGDQLDPDSEMGPLVSSAQLQHVLGLITGASQEGARLVTGGRRVTTEALVDGFFVEPTIFADVAPDMEIAREEVFGPVLAVIPFDDEDHAIEIANNSQYGLASGVWTKNIQRAHRMARRINTGVVWLNCYRNTAPNVPYGGVGSSGFGRENGHDIVLDFTQIKSVWVDTTGATRDPFSIPAAPK